MGIVGDGHATFARSDYLDWMKAEYSDIAIAAVANGFVLIAATDGMRGIFDNLESVLLA